MSFKEIGTAIYTEVDKMRTVDQVVGVVYNYDAKLKDGNFPCIVITPIDGDESILDSVRDEVLYNYSIALIDESSTNASTIEDNMRTISDTLIEHLKDLTTFTLTSGVVVNAVRTYRRGWANDQENLRVFQVVGKYRACKPK